MRKASRRSWERPPATRSLPSSRRSIAPPRRQGQSTRWSARWSSTAQDIRRPLGIAHTYQPEALTLVGDFVIRGNLLLGGKRRATGLTLTATDVDWTRGAGPEVKGPLASIILALTGRKAGLADLTGDGVATLTGGSNAPLSDHAMATRTGRF